MIAMMCAGGILAVIGRLFVKNDWIVLLCAGVVLPASFIICLAILEGYFQLGWIMIGIFFASLFCSAGAGMMILVLRRIDEIMASRMESFNGDES